MAEDKPREKTVRINTRFTGDPSHMDYINIVKFSHVGADVFMDVGVLNLDQLIAAVKTEGDGGEAEVEALVSKRYGMSAQTFGQLRRNVEEMWGKMKEAKGLRVGGLLLIFAIRTRNPLRQGT